jgi:DNA-binding NtrC family response regulator
MNTIKTILLVDDEPELLSILAETLHSFGYNVIPKLDAESALSVIGEGNMIDLVITDLRMPGMDGSEFTRVLKRLLPSVPVILLTGHGSVESYVQTRSDGVFEYVNKPVRAKELRLIVKAALDRSTDGPAMSLPD